MLDHLAQFTAWPIVTGIIVGYIANRIMSGEGKGCCMNLIVGIIGSYAGAFISSLLNVQLLGAGYLKNFIFCLLGSVVVLWIWKKISSGGPYWLVGPHGGLSPCSTWWHGGSSDVKVRQAPKTPFQNW